MAEHLRIGTRKSPLALWQAEHVKARLEAAHPGLSVELVHVVTQGDKILDVPLAQVGGKALFVKELEERLLSGEVDLAVHSMKDVPTVLPEGLGLVATSEREDPFDAFVARDPARTPRLADLPQGARLGTSSLRRACQIRALRPDIEIVSIRGNVGTRLDKLEREGLDGAVLACAGLKRLGFAEKITERLDPSVCLPAIGQGALGIESRLDDARVRALLAILDDPDTERCVAAERGLLGRLEGSCQVPIAGHCIVDGEGLWLRALVSSLDGSVIVRGEARGPREEAEAMGAALAEDLLARGADRILEEIFSQAS